jgi:hypothetical protein
MKTLAAIALAAAAAAPASPVSDFAGRYSYHFQNGLVDGSSFWSDDVVEIVPVDATHAYVRAALNFYNGHTCGIAGIAEAARGTLVYHDTHPPFGSEPPCVLTVSRKGANLVLDDGDNGCKTYCGERGSFGNATLPWKSKRAITYMARLKGSDAYRDAIREWKTGKPAN